MPSCLCSSGRVLLAFNLQSSCLDHSSTGIAGICYHAQLSGVAKDPMLLEQPTQIHSDLSSGLQRRAGVMSLISQWTSGSWQSILEQLSSVPHPSPRRASALCFSSSLYDFGSSLPPSFHLSSRLPSISTYLLPFLKAAVRWGWGGAPDYGDRVSPRLLSHRSQRCT